VAPDGPDSPQIDVQREPDRFVVRRGDAEAELVYEVEGTKLVLVHTGVPEALGGTGIGGALVRAATEWAAGSGLTVVPRCPFARRWLRQHPDVAATVSVDWASARR
jgi:uncharacterized protein